MSSEAQPQTGGSAVDYDRPTIPPATPPVIAANADPEEAADKAKPNGDSDFPGRHPAELPPGEDDRVEPTAPPEIDPHPGDIDRPDSAPDEVEPEQPQVIPPPD